MNTSMRLAFGLCVAVTACAAAQVARADSVTIDGITIDFPTGADGTIPQVGQTNDVLGTQSGWYGATLYLATPGTKVQYTYIGAEAGYTNKFYVDGAERFVHSGTAFGTSYTSGLTGVGGILDFEFRCDTTGANATLANGSNLDDEGATVTRSFFVAYLTTSMVWNGYTLDAGLYLCLDDGGAGADDNHDDMIIRLTAVPEPSSIALMGMALTGIAAAVRRRRARLV